METEEINKPASLPPCSEMIFAAIGNLDEKESSNKTAFCCPPNQKDPFSVVATRDKDEDDELETEMAITAMDTHTAQDDELETEMAATTVATSVSAAPRGRGRSPKVMPEPQAAIRVRNGTTTGTIIYKGCLYSMTDGMAVGKNSQQVLTGRSVKIEVLKDKYLMVISGGGDNLDDLENRIRNQLERNRKLRDVIDNCQNYIQSWEAKEGNLYHAAICISGYERAKLEVGVVCGSPPIGMATIDDVQNCKVIFTGSGAADAELWFRREVVEENIDSEKRALCVLERCMAFAGMKNGRTGGFYMVGDYSKRTKKPEIWSARHHLMSIIFHEFEGLKPHLLQCLLMMTKGKRFLKANEEGVFNYISTNVFDEIVHSKILGMQLGGELLCVWLIEFHTVADTNAAWSKYCREKREFALPRRNENRWFHGRGKKAKVEQTEIKLEFFAASKDKFGELAQNFEQNSW